MVLAEMDAQQAADADDEDALYTRILSTPRTRRTTASAVDPAPQAACEENDATSANMHAAHAQPLKSLPAPSSPTRPTGSRDPSAALFLRYLDEGV